MDPTRELIAKIDQDKVEQALRQSPQDKFRAGLELFDLACQVMKDGIRMQHPGADEFEVKRQLRARLALLDDSEAAA